MLKIQKNKDFSGLFLIQIQIVLFLLYIQGVPERLLNILCADRTD